MKKQFTLLKVSLAGSFFALVLTGANAKADVYYVCAGTPLTVEAQNVETGGSVIWDITDGTNTIPGFIPSSSTTFTWTFNDAGTYIVKLNQVSASPAECTSDPAEHTVHVLPAFTVNITGDSQYCIEDAQATTLTAVVTSGDPSYTLPSGVGYTYEWFQSDGSGTATGTAVGTGLTYEVPAIITSGDNYFTLNVAYALDATVTGSWLGSPCEADAAAPALIDVLPKPSTPTISITAN